MGTILRFSPLLYAFPLFYCYVLLLLLPYAHCPSVRTSTPGIEEGVLLRSVYLSHLRNSVGEVPLPPFPVHCRVPVHRI